MIQQFGDAFSIEFRQCATFPFPESGFSLKAVAEAGGAWGIASTFREENANVHLVDFGFEPFKEALHAIPLVESFLVVGFPFENKLYFFGA